MAKNGTISYEPKNVADLTNFFTANKDKFHEIWIIIIKKTRVNPQPVSFDEAVTEALKQGLVDSRTKTLDEERYAIRFTKRIKKIVD
jgi:hypothetical protein